MRLILGFLLSTIAMPLAVQAQAASSSAEAIEPRAVAASLGAKLASDFVYPEQGRRYAAALEANARSGAYDGLAGVPLADRLSQDLQTVAADGHLRVQYRGEGGGGPQIIVKRPPVAEGSPPPPGQQPRMVRLAPPPATEHAGWIAPGIAFVRFNLFPGEPANVEAARQFMKAHADARVIIFDVRTHRGGGLAEMDAIFPWLFSQPTRLVTMATRKEVDSAGKSPISDVPTLRLVQGDPAFVTREHWVTPGPDQRLNDAKIYVLTSGFTASAAEHFALAMKHNGRATLVGGATHRANHFGGVEDLGGGFTAFIPVGRTFDPRTSKDWEGVGVAPDVDIAAEQALIKALTLAGVPQAEAEGLSAKVAPPMPMPARR